MGFGILFIGYFITFVMSSTLYGYVFKLIGYFMMMSAVGKLNLYNTNFKRCAYPLLPLFIFAMYEAFADIYGYFSGSDTFVISDKISQVSLYAVPLLLALFHIFLTLAIFDIARQTELKNIQSSIITDFVFFALYFILYYLTLAIAPQQKFLIMAIFIIRWAWTVLFLVSMASCYRNICDENDIDMKRKPSRFAFVNKFLDELDRREQAGIDKSVEYVEKQLKKKKRK